MNLVSQKALFLRAQPLRRFDLVVEVKPHHDADQHGGHAFKQKQPLPSGPTVHAGERLQDPTGGRTPDDARHGQGCHEKSGDTATALGWKPLAQIKNDSREKAGFGNAQHEADDVELGWRRDEHRQTRDHAPGDHDAGHHLASADSV